MEQFEEEEIIYCRQRYNRNIEQMEIDEIFNLAMKLGLEEEDVEKVWNDAA